MKELKEILNEVTPIGTEWMSIRRVDETTSYRIVRNENPEENFSANSTGYMVEVRQDGHYGYAATNSSEVSDVRQAALRASKMAENSAPWKIANFSKESRVASQTEWRTQYDSSNSLSAAEWFEFLINACKTMNINSVLDQRFAGVRTDHSIIEIVDTNNTHCFQDIYLNSANLSVTGKRGDIVQSRSDNGGFAYSRQGTEKNFLNYYTQGRITRIAEECLELLDADDCPTGKMDALLMPNQMMLQIHESIGHPLELDRIMGDERNYAGNSFVQLSDFGTLKYGSDIMNVTFNPEIKNQYASFGFDDNGTPTEKAFIIRNGMLERGLGGIESQERSGVSGVACARANLWSRPPIDRMANLNLEPGQSSFEDIVSQVENGVLMDSNRSWSIDDFRNKFQFGCEYGRLIKDGKLGKVVRNPNYRGVTLDFWSKLKAVGDQKTFEVYGTPFCGKGEPNQVIRVGHASPACLFSDLEVFGGGN